MADDAQISKTLSYWLRHRPDAAGIVLDDAGWAPVDAVLAALDTQMPGTDWDRLLDIVERSDKQRFELSGDVERIRARQGHSVQVTGDWPVTQPPETLFHGTVERFLPTILDEGLKPMLRHHVHLSSDVVTARKVGARRGKPIILVVQAARLASDGAVFRLTSNGVWLVEHVPAGFISIA
jgi:putative RNA 2'-phosphotransferase